MFDNNYCNIVLLPQIVNSFHNAFSSTRVKKRCWLIEHNHARLHSQDPGQGNTLLLTPRKLVWSQVLQPLRPRSVHRPVHSPPDLLPGQAQVLRTKCDIFFNSQREELVLRVLKHISYSPGDLARQLRRDRLTIDEEFP